MHCAPGSASFRKGVTFWASLINNLVAFVGAFISVFVDKHCANSAVCVRWLLARVVWDTEMLTYMPLRYHETTFVLRLVPRCRHHRCVRASRDYWLSGWLSPRTSLPNANCLRISNEPLKYRTQWLRPPEAKASGTRARNGAVNESPSGRGRRVGEVEPR